MKIFDRLLGLLPSWLPFAATALLLAGLVGGYFALRSAWRAEAAAGVIAADQKAVIDQQRRDAALSKQIIARQAEQLAALEEKANAIVKRIDNAPKTTGCGPVMRDASRGLHELFGGAGGAPAGRQPAAAVPGPGAGARP
ncbi:MAG: hypothetical protein J0J01_05095 [Reyranella sp.]|uniref:hypothetical protein n=1 Tax=Reyranella sp. TaxID=1929291 RepID=UPI001AC68BC2|nr:hypothetical protein [Reyranella sp.]MBN9086261.1 hypothetical protein [Reyranella sp.]